MAKPSWGGAGAGALSGAAVGTSIMPVWGTAIGGVLGGLLGLFSGNSGKEPKVKQMNKYNPEQMQFLSQLRQQSQGATGNAFNYINSILGDDEKTYKDFEAPAMRQFQEEIVPSILERNTSMGGGNSSALNQSLGRAGKELSTDLSAQRAGLKQNALQHLMNYSQMGLQQETSPYIKGGSQGAFEMLAPSLGQAGGNALFDLLNAKYGGNAPTPAPTASKVSSLPNFSYNRPNISAPNTGSGLPTFLGR